MLCVDILIVAAFCRFEMWASTPLPPHSPRSSGSSLMVLRRSCCPPRHAILTRAPTPRLLRMSGLINAAAGVASIVVARRAIDVVFGPAFAGAVAPVPLLVVACIAGGVWKIVGAEIVARGTADAAAHQRMPRARRDGGRRPGRRSVARDSRCRSRLGMRLRGGRARWCTHAVEGSSTDMSATWHPDSRGLRRPR